jgi:RHS repeat-associated protein
LKTANASGNVLDDIDYRGFGDIAANYGGAQTTNHYLYTGYESDDSENNTDFAQFRNHSPYMGRFSRPDPYDGSYDATNPQTLNRYSYVFNMPLMYTDPLGLDVRICSTTWSEVFVVGEKGAGTNHMAMVPDTVCYIESSGGGGSGPGGGGGAAPNNPCANATLTATGVNPQQNISQANRNTATGALLGLLTIGDPLTGALAGYAYTVRTGGSQDVKNHPGPGTYQQRVDAGNISYGITCMFGASFCQFAAGMAQTLAGHPDPNGTLMTGYDTPSDNASIRQGQAMRAAGCH